MAFTTSTSPTEDIIVQEGTFAFSYTCSGSVFAGQAVQVCEDLKVKAGVTKNKTLVSGCVGVAAYDQTDGNLVAVYGPGNIVRVVISGTSKCTHGAHLAPVGEGKFSALGGAYASGISAIALEDQATANGSARVLLI